MGKRAGTVLSLLTTTGCFGAVPYAGPVSNHFDGIQFRNMEPTEVKGFYDVLRWKMTSEAATWPDFVEIEEGPTPPERVQQGIRIQFINHATVLIQMDGVNLVTDPVWSKRVSPISWVGPARHKSPGIALESLPPIDAVLVSHNHYDHMDLPTLRRIAERDDPMMLVGLGNARPLQGDHLLRAQDMDWWDTKRIAGVEIIFTPAQHWSGRTMGDHNHTLWGGFFVRGPSGSVYFAGDTGDGPHFAETRQRLGSPTVALLPIGAYEPRWFMASQHINPEEAVKAHVTLGATISIGIHWGTFQLTDESMEAPREALHEARKRAQVPDDRFLVLENGEVWGTRNRQGVGP
ncbi:MAG: MBL fold metallo-hydrolase [Myxococcales bacterium]|nr:MBL fold metallo-hydrolase [Myxococcales bacterium]